MVSRRKNRKYYVIEYRVNGRIIRKDVYYQWYEAWTIWKKLDAELPGHDYRFLVRDKQMYVKGICLD